ncbi:zinc-dependent alcohol dehydrogenase family protein [Algoriphagus sp. NF]|uniref:zinc-dependent alcohol dehydrogenase family protein n=1 Tax=Algoriphagus sp. NF TaxID=2992756 RepID=UPI00237B4F26|nr:zinc-dependent alcohol dehydrogenase family protein [Algoriphagus sp. NF]MDE0560384.1 zinc-dependent alcohol dehydrogenase family protein [Algoriphagus sp. NF]
MKALVYEQFQTSPKIQKVKDPTPEKNGVVIEVKATGLCRSDWHGWMGHDEDIELPHVPGHEFAGIVSAVGKNVKKWKIGDRVTVPFVCACGICPTCASGNQHVCDDQFQPGFTHWGSFAEYVRIDRANTNLVAIPESMEFETAASLGCRFATSFRAVVDQGKVSGGQWVAVFGCGGVGLSAIMIAKALGAQVIAIDISEKQLQIAKKLGADVLLNPLTESAIPTAILEITHGGAHVSLDCLGKSLLAYDSVASLRKRGKHIQVGLLLDSEKDTALPMNLVIAKELEILGSHGMQAWRYQEMMDMISTGKLKPELLIGKTISLEEATKALPEMNKFENQGITIINQF